jgi:hypothetical protein
MYTRNRHTGGSRDMTTATAERPVSWPEFARAHGLTVDMRREILAERLVTPAVPPRRGAATQITPESADRVSAAVALAPIIGLAVIVILRALTKAGAKVDGPVVTIPLPAH